VEELFPDTDSNEKIVADKGDLVKDQEINVPPINMVTPQYTLVTYEHAPNPDNSGEDSDSL
jgi:hypothetical protein